VQTYSYCEQWFRGRKRAIGWLSAAQAEELHHAGKLYTVLVGDEAKPTCFLEVRPEAGFVGVSFLNDLMCEYLIYHFKQQSDKRLFLFMALHRVYAPQSDSVTLGQTFIFSPTGKVAIELVDLQSNQRERKEFAVPIDENWEQFPPFGAYDNLIRVERGLGLR
jgi:hypothetical protein